ncbi:sugar ABC transporter ATP-binding protein [bacterium]|nr:sugar ABC transporter ATP-binding protein [bacterium]
MNESRSVKKESDKLDIILKARQVSKKYPGTLALNQVDFNVYRGKVNVLVGENGAGKSTLMKIIAGAIEITSGKLLLEDEEIVIRNVDDAAKYGIGIVYQELNLFPNLNIAENIFMAREIRSKGPLIDHQEQILRTKALMKQLEQAIDPKELVSNLRIGQQQIVEIAKALSQDVNILIMDEPSSALSSAEVSILFKMINELKARGVSIIYISHRLEELIQIGDYITVLRDGKLEAEAEIKNIDVQWIVEKMVGESAEKKINHTNKAQDKEVLNVENVCLSRQGGGFTVDHVSISLKAGEIVGLYGLMGAGRSELFDCLMGLEAEAKGTIILDGQDISKSSVVQRIQKGMALIPEDRQREGLIQVMSVTDNMTLSSLWAYLKGFHILAKKVKASVEKCINDISIKVSSPQVVVSSLSGGNQQKVVIGKALLTSPKVLLMDEPGRGIDVGAKTDVFKIMNDLAEKGLGILFVTTELKEILSISDRIIVMSKGKITGEFDRQEATEEILVNASAIGHKLETPLAG